MVQLKQSLDLSLELKVQDKETGRRVVKYWNDFGKHFLAYVKKREKETGEEILGGFSISKLI
ncbi:MAG TPA: hypothetical protein VN456_14250, partial [Desulfosporosinus sp.]|nr:hypothetical protein [Desulfosporosinus sp.]